MPRGNLRTIILLVVLAIVCHHQVQKSRYGQVVADAMGQVQSNYLEPVKSPELFEGAMEGMVRSLGDDYSAYITPKSLPRFKESIEHEFEGVGMEVAIDPKTKQLMVMCPLLGTPAYEAGIRAGDRILKIDGQSTDEMTLDEAIRHMRGKPGGSVALTVQHEGDQKPVDITIVRAVIHVESVLGDTRNRDGSWNFFLEGHDRIGYVRINAFAEKTASELQTALRWLLDHQMHGLILDLRDNPGGLLSQAVEASRMLVDSGVIVTTRGRGGSIRTKYEARPGTAMPNFPLAVLVNGRSASASEIVAACVQDHGRAVIIGERTWGKGTVQEVLELGENQGALRLTVASYWRPSEKNIHRFKDATEKDDWGVRPDKGYEVTCDETERAKWTRWRLQRDGRRTPGTNGDDLRAFVDRPVAKAVEYLKQSALAKR
jgi:carboxyl-terminal processing protease